MNCYAGEYNLPRTRPSKSFLLIVIRPIRYYHFPRTRDNKTRQNAVMIIVLDKRKGLFLYTAALLVPVSVLDKLLDGAANQKFL